MHSISANGGVQHQRNVTRDQAGWAVGHQRGQSVVADQLVKNVDALFVEMWWYVHGYVTSIVLDPLDSLACLIVMRVGVAGQ